MVLAFYRAAVRTGVGTMRFIRPTDGISAETTPETTRHGASEATLPVDIFAASRTMIGEIYRAPFAAAKSQIVRALFSFHLLVR